MTSVAKGFHRPSLARGLRDRAAGGRHHRTDDVRGRIVALLGSGLYLTLGYGVQAVVADELGVWGPAGDEDRGYNIRFLGHGFLDEEGAILTEAEVDALSNTTSVPAAARTRP